jgi:hypothetical protein
MTPIIGTSTKPPHGQGTPRVRIASESTVHDAAFRGMIPPMRAPPRRVTRAFVASAVVLAVLFFTCFGQRPAYA